MLLDRRGRAAAAPVVCLALVVLAACGGESATEPKTKQTKTTTSPGGGQPQLPGSDSFEGRALAESWGIVHRNLVQVAVQKGALTLTLKAPALWFQGSEGVLAFKPVEGNFTATATVHTSKESNRSQPPAPTIRLAGLMARSPAGEAAHLQNYVHIVVGNGPDGVLAIENKTTMNSNSVYEAPAWPSADAQLRICRVGQTFNLYKRPIGSGAWQLAASYERTDLPRTLDVGADIYSPNTPPDLRATWDEVTYTPAASLADCET